jgi:hypothetical protein
MRLRLALLLGVLSGVCGGCISTEAENVSSPFQVAHSQEIEVGPDEIQLDVAVVERPYGDRFLNFGLWELADEQGINLERKAVLEDNGFRVCQIGGLPPAEMQGLLTSKRSCPDPRRLRTGVGMATTLLMGPTWPICGFRLAAEGAASRDVEYENAQCLLDVVATLAEDNRINLKFTPRVRHGQPSRVPQAQKDESGALIWQVDGKQPEDVFPELAWELKVASGDYVVVGARLNEPDGMALCLFVPPGDRNLKQKILVVRAARSAQSARAEKRSNAAPPLALQAALPTARGASR